MRILIFGGTTEGRKLCEFLISHEIGVSVCVATNAASKILPDNPLLKIYEGRLDEMQITNLISEYDLVIDATHPYAQVVTSNIKAAVDICSKEYIRLVRPSISYDNVIEFENIAAASKYLENTNGNILVTTGSKELLPFTNITGFKERLHVRVLPTVDAVKACEEKLILPSNIIAMQGPFSKELNMAIINQTDSRYLVTKESGDNGGFEEKLSAASELGVTVILVGRPLFEEGKTFNQVIEYFKDILNLEKTLKLSHFPLFIDLSGKEICVVGAGKIATRRVLTLIKFGAQIKVIAPIMSDDIKKLSDSGEITVIEELYKKEHIKNSFIVIAATNDKDVNKQIAIDANDINSMVNIADDKSQSSFYFPAVFYDNEILGGIISHDGNNHSGLKKSAEKIRKFLINEM